jgi:hypothetical protein
MKYFDLYITFAFFIKILFIILALINILLKFKGQGNSKLDIKIKYWKERVEFVFVTSMALLMIYLFMPRTNRASMIDKETKFLFFLFGIILLITAKWDDFVSESKFFISLQNSFGEVGSR